ncbi:MAG: hypothetical protein EHM41_00315 [Chloroflexi bacterium]|nr:MAG: hypothetical protein EHM41_00315 [Chloroflexota bacterium]
MAKKLSSKLSQAEWEQRFVSAFKPMSDMVRPTQELDWFRNILYYLGQQWIEWFTSESKFGRKYAADVNVPTPVSNLIREYVRSKKALVLNKAYSMTVWPNSAEQFDKDAAEVGQNILDHLRTADDEEDLELQEETAMWWLICGNAFPRVFPDMERGGYIPFAEGVVGRGEVGMDIVLPFNIKVPTIGTRLKRKPWVGIHTLVLKEWLEDTYKVKVEGSASGELDYQKELLTLVGNVSSWNSSGDALAMDIENKDLVIVKELEYRPTATYPKGQYAIMAGNDVIYTRDDMLIPTDADSGFWSYSVTHVKYDLVPGSFWATGAVDDLLSPQRTINEIDQALEINRKSFGRPFLLTPAELTLKRVSARGQGILAVTYDAMKARNLQPTIHQGVPYPAQIIEERSIKMEAAQNAGGDPKNVMKGSQPSANASGTLFDIMREAAEQSHAPDIKRFYRAWKQVERKKLILAQTLFSEERMIKYKGKGNEALVKRYKGSDIHNNFDVRMDLDSGIASTQAGTKDMMMQLLQYKLWDPSIPAVTRREVLKRVGLGGFPEESNVHRDRAEWENSMISTGQMDIIATPGIPDKVATDPQTGQEDIASYKIEPVVDPVFKFDNHQIHLVTHAIFIFSREFKGLTKAVQLLALGHYEMHKVTMEQEMAQQAAQGAALEAAAKGKTAEQPGAVPEAGGETDTYQGA